MTTSLGSVFDIELLIKIKKGKVGYGDNCYKNIIVTVRYNYK